jgi:hypothetical protein
MSSCRSPTARVVDFCIISRIRNWIQLFTLIRILIQFFTVVRIGILLLIKEMRISQGHHCDLHASIVSLDASIVSLHASIVSLYASIVSLNASIVSIHDPLRLNWEPGSFRILTSVQIRVQSLTLM